MSYGTAEAVARRVRSLPQGLQRHIQRVQEVAAELASVHDADGERVRLGAMAHDVARAMSGDELLAHARDMGIQVHPVEAAVPVLLHGPVGAELLRRRDGLEDREVYEAVYWHSTAHKDLGVLGKIVFLADKLDPHKKARYPFIGDVEKPWRPRAWTGPSPSSWAASWWTLSDRAAWSTRPRWRPATGCF